MKILISVSHLQEVLWECQQQHEREEQRRSTEDHNMTRRNQTAQHGIVSASLVHDELLAKPRDHEQIVIETDGSAVRIVSADVAGNIELVVILEVIIDALRNKR